jgi:predicted ATPase/DNA-binding CsgD family transcriptional regulator
MSAGALIGREREVSTLARMLADDDLRLVTVTGPPGVGKTRLAYAVADRVRTERELRLVRVELGPVGDAGRVTEAIAAAACAGDAAPRRTALADAAAALKETPALLVLDNFEHVAEAATDVATLLDACPDLTVLTTSRHVLGLTAEHMFPLMPLGLPEPWERDVERAARSPSVALFVARARARDPRFELTPEVAPAVAEICHRLDGLPLAIELVAARAAALPPPALVERWEDAVALDTRGARDLPPRQQTLRRALDWSYRLLDPAEQALLRRLAAFPGGFDLAAVEAACRGDGGTLPALDLRPLPAIAALVDRSLVERTGDSTAEPRYSQLVIVRAYLRERLAAHGEAAAADRVLANACAALATEPDQFLGRGGTRETYDRIERELHNIHAALDVLVRTEPQRAVGLAANLFGFWRARRVREGRESLERALAAAGPRLDAATRARAHWTGAMLALTLGDGAAVQAHAASSLEAAREAGDDQLLARALYAEGTALWVARDVGAASRLHESLALAERVGDNLCAAGVCVILGELSRAALDLAEAALYSERAHTLFRDVGDVAGTAVTAHNVAQVMIARGELDRADILLLETLAESTDFGSRRLRAYVLAGLTVSAAARERTRAVATLAGVTAAELARAGESLHSLDEQAFEEVEALLRSALGEQEFTAAAARGRALGDVEQQRLLDRLFRHERPAETNLLTKREVEVVRLMADGLTNGEIAARLVLSDHTVHRHVANILRKLDVRSRAAAASHAARIGLL